MGTEYKFYADEDFGELIINEMSNQLTLNFIGDDEYVHPSKDMTPEELAKVFIKGLQICSYWMDEVKLKRMINHYMNKF